MKKLFALLCLSCLLCNGAIAQVYFEPVWSEFGPSNSTYTRYWTERKNAFDERKSFCQKQTDKDECYKELREYERYLTTLYATRNSNVATVGLDELPGWSGRTK